MVQFLGDGWTQRSMCYMRAHIGANWRIRLNRTCSAALQKRLTDRDAVCSVDSGGSKEPCIRSWSRSSHAKRQFSWERTCPGMHEDTLPWAVQKWLNGLRFEMPFRLWTRVGPKKLVFCWGADWRHLANTIEPFMWCGNAAFLSNYFDHLFLLEAAEVVITVKAWFRVKMKLF